MDFEQSLIDRLLQHDDLAFAQFYEQSSDIFFRYIISHYDLDQHEVEDILSDIYLKLRNNLDKYDKNYKFGQFVWTVVKNYCKDYFKTSKLVSFSSLQSPYSQEGDTSSIDLLLQEDNLQEFVDQQFDLERIQKALSSLDMEVQELVYSRYILQYSYEDLAHIYNIDNATLRKKISRAMEKVRNQLQ